jgi:hypothetical protein
VSRRNRPRKAAANITDLAWAYLCDADLSEHEPGFEGWLLEFNVDNGTAALWQEHGPVILEWWMIEHPGTRPSLWWQFDAPREPIGTWPDCYYDGMLPLPRQRIGGIGTPKFDVFAYSPNYRSGIPTLWVESWEVEYYSGRAKDIHGNPIGQNFAGKHFAGLAIDPQNPPVFEAEATYLDRHNLLLPGERKRLTAADFAPERITDIIGVEP